MINNDKPLGFWISQGFVRIVFRQNRIQNMQNIILNMSQFAGSIDWMDSEVL